MKNKKSIFFIIAILVLGVSTTFAYFTGSINLDNLFVAASWNNEAREVFESPENWKPGDVTQKEVSVKNNGNTPSRVRISIFEEWKEENDNPLPLIHNGESVAIINLVNTEDWVKSGNYYYYNKDLNANEETSLFMESVTFNPNYTGDIECTISNDGHSKNCVSTGNLYDGGTYKLTVNVEMVQADVYESVWNVTSSSINNPTEFTITLDTNGGSSSTYKVQATVGQTYSLPIPVKTGYGFMGWYKDSNFTQKVTNTDTVDLNSDTVFYAKFVPTSELTYNVIFASSDTTNCPLDSNTYQTIQNVNYGDVVSRNATPNPECTGYTFDGWTASNNISLDTAKYGITSIPETSWVNGNKGTYFKALSTIGEDVTLTAYWTIHSNNVTIKPEGGSVKVTSPTDGTETTVTTDTTKTQNYNTTLTYATPTKADSTSTSSSWTVSYDTDGGSAAPSSQNSTRTIVTNYTFKEWTTTGTCGTLTSTTYTFPANDSTTCTLTATYNSSVKSDTAEEITLPAAPTKTGYTFNGWKTGSTTKQAGEGYTPTADTTFTAQWTPVNYTITYNLDGGSITGETTSYNIETATFTLPTPTKTNYTFTGWIGSNGTTPQTTVTITQGSTGDKTYTANWKVDCTKVNCTNAVTLVKSKATKIDDDFYIYTGKTPANYVKFNGQTWRILGVYKDKVKIINVENKLTSQQYSLINNVWSSSTVKSTLNGTYYSGLTNDAKAMIVQGEWNAGAASIYANASASYTSAKATKVTTNSLVGTMAAYEYQYAAESSCWATMGIDYRKECYQKDWLYTGSYVWTLNPDADDSRSSLVVDGDDGCVYGKYTVSFDNVLPAVYLNSSVLIIGGDGTTSNTAYELSL